MKINEGLKKNDLKDLIFPLINFDEYESKLGEKTLVLGFYSKLKDPASDLNRFIQKSFVQIIDCDVSPSPTPEGYYMVFVEILKDNNLEKNIISLLKDIKTLCGNDKWYFYKDDVVFSLEDLNKLIKKAGQ